MTQFRAFSLPFPSLLLAAGVLLFASGGCRKEDNAPGFDMIYQQQFTIPAGIGSNAVHHFYLKNIPSRYDQYLSEHNRSDADIVQILTAQVVLTGLFGDADFDFIDEAKLRIYNESDVNDFVEIAYRFPVPLQPGNSLPLIPNLPDVKRFLAQPRFSVDLALRLRNITQMETETRLDLKMRAAF